MPKMKTRKTAAKRFKITASGKVMRLHTRRNHLMINKDANRRRHLKDEAEVTGGMAERVKSWLPHSF